MVFILYRARRDFSREKRAQSDTRLHREHNFAMKNKTSGGSKTCAVEDALAPLTLRQERRGGLETLGEPPA